MRARRFVATGAVLLAVQASAKDVTLPAAASIIGGAPFISDVRAFNTSYASALDVTARYRCFIPSPCSAVGVSEIQFTLAPRESRSFNDIVAITFQAPNTAGGVEFDHSGGDEQLVVTSRLYSTFPEPTVGMFISGLHGDQAHARTVLTSIRNGGPNQGFRTNVGAYNREDEAVTVTFTIFDGGTQVGNPVTQTVAGHSGVQVNRIFQVAGQAAHVTENAVVVVAASHKIFSYAAVIDNNTTDPIFVRGAEDQSAPAPTPSPTAGPVRVRRVALGPGFQFRDEAEGGGTSRIAVGTTIEWVWEGGGHSTTSGPCSSATCMADGNWNSGVRTDGTFRLQFDQPGTFPYFCDPHSDQMRGAVIVSP